MIISIIIPTLNRVRLLRNTLLSVLNLDSSNIKFELLIVDNGSTDGTEQFARSFIHDNNVSNFSYIREPTPGLLSCRHRGYEEANGNILAYLDDDVIVSQYWLQGIQQAFSDASVHLAGGPSLPYYEESPPGWLDYFWNREPSLHSCPSLSLIWQGEKVKKCEPDLIWGLNFCIRKQTMKQAGGFNPDCIPGHLQHFQGDGESGLARKLKQLGHTGLYHPGIMLHHVIPSERMTHEYFNKRFYYEGIVCSYADIRKEKGLPKERTSPVSKNNKKRFTRRFCQKILHPRSSVRWFLSEKGYIKKADINSTLTVEEKLKSKFHQSYLYGYNFHREMVNNFPGLLKWILKEDYFDYQLPELIGFSN